MATRTNWKELYTNLPENIATVLREKRIKPEQLITKTDGEILAYGLSDTDLETIRAKYTPTTTTPQETGKPSKTSTSELTETKAVSTSHFSKYPRHIYGRSKRYQSLMKKINRNQTYSPKEAIEKLLSLAKKGKSIDLHLNVIETGLRGEVKMPFSTGKITRVEIFSDKTISGLNENKFNFDILLATPADMPRLAKYAKILGPKGLMPNPKNGTITTDPEGRAKELSAGATASYKTEPKFPLIHISLGKTDQKPEELAGNLTTLLKEIGLSKITSAYLTANQNPSMKLDLSSI